MPGEGERAQDPATEYVVLRQHVVTIPLKADDGPVAAQREARVWEELGRVKAPRRAQAFELAVAQHPEITPAAPGVTERVHLVSARSWREIVRAGEQDEVRVTTTGV